MKPVHGVVVLAMSWVLLAGCSEKHSDPSWAYAPDMHYSVGLKAQKEGSMRPPVKGTIPRGFLPYEITSIDEAGKILKNPLPASSEVMHNGKNLFNVYCIVCHGKYGEGDGSIIGKFPRPPSLQSDKIRDYKDGQIFHVITLGQTLMPSYADKLSEQERWSIIHYLRVLYRAKHPTSEDMKKAEGFVEE